MNASQSVELYRSSAGEFELAAQTDSETVWLSAEPASPPRLRRRRDGTGCGHHTLVGPDLRRGAQVIDQISAEFPANTPFGGERGRSLRGVIATIFQGFGGVKIYPTVQTKATNILYLVVKDHPPTDGNSAALPRCLCISWRVTAHSTMFRGCRAPPTMRLPRSR